MNFHDYRAGGVSGIVIAYTTLALRQPLLLSLPVCATSTLTKVDPPGEVMACVLTEPHQTPMGTKRKKTT